MAILRVVAGSASESESDARLSRRPRVRPDEVHPSSRGIDVRPRHLTTARTEHPVAPPAFPTREPSMSRYLAPLCFTLATVWVAVIFVLVSH
ncbi:MAG: hypothetical protein QOE03_1356 [Micromonosporaceae bacterium]|jgi:hypothetical protein|nr:hypothetical protein [Micromonosporaceae bacterium]